ncbi:FHA domain-containing protein [Amnibacterium kyonggiense]|uniref:RDD domain-containing protein n=1 Tax=Amnibacterium kyonggiense TaxID=595671 RepID=A0A4R7FSJ6_9MICO|nr:FHA domain-containing protein [Amnibacterium kyonggiense]TDS80845.1 hypothetical protein CLV52_1415 [Amnibacterium kyonggiense]
MPHALLPAATCGRCAAPVAPVAARCTVCGVRLDDVAPGSALAGAGPLDGVFAASGGRRRTALLVDLAVVLAAGAAVAAAVELASRALARDVLLATEAGVLAALIAVGALAGALRASGRTPGRAGLGLRTVDALSGLPTRRWGVAVAAVLTGRSRSLVTADLRQGRDPAAPRIVPVALAADTLPEARAAAAARAPSPVDTVAARLVVDSGDELVVDGPVLLGRAPEQRPGVRRVHALPDLSRGIARTHLLVDWAEGLLWVTDLGSPGGTSVRSEAGAFRPLVPEVRTAVAPGWRIRLGGRELTVRSVAVEEGAPRG